MRHGSNDHLSRSDKLTSEMPMRDNHSADQRDGIRLGIFCIHYFHVLRLEARCETVTRFLGTLALRMSRCTARASKPARRSRLLNSLATMTERCRPPVQPIPTVT